MNNQVRGIRIVGLEVYPVVVLAIHARMHHENAGLEIGAFAWFECHRTDGQAGRSAALQYFNVRLLFKPKQAIPGVSHLDLELAILAELDIAIINGLLIHGHIRRAAAIVRRAAVGKEEHCYNEKKAPQSDQWPEHGPLAFLLAIFLPIIDVFTH
jgi:hypothetical protein